MSSTLAEIMPALAAPFDPRDVDFLPKPKYLIERDGKTLCKSLPFADKRVYEDRLNEVCPGEWTSQAVMIVAGNKLVCVSTVVICGVAHTDTGEADLSSENAATEALAQAFKRACSQVGLGRFLYALQAQYLPWDKLGKGKYAINAAEKLAIVREMYRKAGFTVARIKTGAAPAPESPATSEQLATLADLATKAQRKIARPKTYGAAQALITELSA